MIEYHFCSQFKPEMVAVVHDCAKFKYECGNYTDASEYLYFYRVLVSVFLPLYVMKFITSDNKYYP